MDERDLLEDLENDPAIRQANPLLYQFYTQRQATAMDYLYETDVAIGSIFDSVSMSNSTIYNQRLQQAISLNNQVISNEPFEMQERSMNDKYLKIAQGQNLTQVEWTEIETLARKCPYLDGYGVYKARVMYTMIAPGSFFDDLDICNSLGYYKNGNTLYANEIKILKGSSNSTNSIEKAIGNQVKVYPNPAQSYVDLSFEYEKDNKYIFELYDAVGRKVIEKELTNGQSRIQLNRNALGVYTYKVIRNHARLQSGKLIIE